MESEGGLFLAKLKENISVRYETGRINSMGLN